MSGYPSGMGSENYWHSPGEAFPTDSYYESDYSQFQNQQLDFKPLQDYGGNGQMAASGSFSPMYEQQASFVNGDCDDDIDELPLLEELEIYPDRIAQKVLAVLNPFRSHAPTDDPQYLTKDPDLAGPIAFYLVLAVSLFLTGNKAHFGYIYGISVVSCVIMYCLLSLMTSESGVFHLTTVASILGYSLIPIIGLSVLGIFFSLQGPVGIVLAALAVLWSSASASRLIAAISGDKEQQPLTAYPCALVSGVYVLLVIF